MTLGFVYLQGTADMRGALYDKDTKFPEGFDPEKHGMVLVHDMRLGLKA